MGNKWWSFWNPDSGYIGGIIMGVLATIAIALIIVIIVFDRIFVHYLDGT